MEIDDASSDDCGDWRASEWTSVERSVAALGLSTSPVERPLKLRIENCHIGPGVFAQRAAILQIEDPPGIYRAQLNQTFQTNNALMDQIEGQADRRFQTSDAEWSLIEFELLFIRVVRGMVCGDAVDGAVA